MKKLLLSVIFIVCIQLAGFSQQRMEPGMNYIYNPKPNSILYHDTLFRGSMQFESLFYRYGDQQMIDLYRRHQSSKIFGQGLGIVGALATVFGVSIVTSSDGNKGLGWGLLGGGFAASLTGGFLTLMSQRNLQMAVTLFNAKQHRAALGIGLGDKKSGLVFSF